MMNPLDTLQNYLLELDEGIGTAYERYALNFHFSDLIKRYGIKTVCEVPANGVMGVPGIKSLIFAKCGCDVTLVNPNQKLMDEVKQLWQTMGLTANFVVSDYTKTKLKDDSFDLVWNFCVYEHFQDPQKMIKEMTRLSNRYVLLEIQNIFNIGLPFHRLYHLVRGEVWDHGNLAKMDHHTLQNQMRNSGLNIKEVDATDMPPWPDINMRIGQAACQVEEGPGCELRPTVRTLGKDEILRRWQQVDEKAEFPGWMKTLKLWHQTIELHSPRLLRIYLSHHPYVLGEKSK